MTEHDYRLLGGLASRLERLAPATTTQPLALLWREEARALRAVLNKRRPRPK